MNLLLLDGDGGGGPPQTPAGRRNGGVLAYGFSADMVGVLDFNGFVRVVNPSQERPLGYESDELLGRQALELIHPGDRDRVASELRLARLHGYPSVLQARTRARDGSYGTVVWGAGAGDERRPLRDPGMNGHGRVRQGTEALERSNRQLERFACDVAHDISQPLQVVSMLAGRLGDSYGGDLPDEARRMIRSIRDGADRAAALVADMLAYSKAVDGPTMRSVVDCNDALARAIEVLEETISELGAEVTRDDLPTLKADPIQLEQVLRNLVSNALKFHNGGQIRVHVGASREGAAWRLSVEDNGIGVEESGCERIFEMFRRGHADVYAGSGIGLSICKRIVERHGGRIWAEPRPAGGSAFRFTIPDASTNA